MKTLRTFLRLIRNPRSGENLGQKIARNAFWLTAGDVLNRLLKAVLIIFITRILPVAEYGAFSFSLNLLSLTFIAADFGISNVLQRKFSEREDKEYLSTSFVIKAALLVIATFIAVVAAKLSDPRITGIALVLIFMMAFDVLKGFFLVIPSSQNRMDKTAIANTVETFVTVAVGLLVLIKFPSAIALAWVYSLGALASLFFVLSSVKTYLRNLFSSVNLALMKQIVAAGWPLALGGMAWGLMNTTDSLILGWLKGLELVAFYNAAAKIPQFLGPIGGIIIGATFPSLVLTLKNPETHKRLFERINELLFSITLPIAAGGLIVAAPLIVKLYGANYRPAAFVFGFLIVNLVQTAISFFLAQLIFVHNHQTKSLSYISLGWAMNIALSFTLIPTYGMTGAALASLISQSFIFVSHTHFVRKTYGLNIFYGELIKPFIAASVMVAALLLIHAGEKPVLFTIPFGAMMYGIILLALKPKVLTDLKSIWKPVHPQTLPPIQPL